MQQDLLRIDAVAHSDRTIVSLKGELDLSNSTSLIECLATVVQERPAHLDVDVSQLEYTDSVGLSVFVTAHFQCRDAGVPLRLLNPNLFVQEILAVTGLEDVLDVVKSTALCGA
jgi:anti-sigma B factor antagonist